MNLKFYVRRFESGVTIVWGEGAPDTETTDLLYPFVSVNKFTGDTVEGYIPDGSDFWAEAYPASPADRAFAVRELGGRAAVEARLQKLYDAAVQAEEARKAAQQG